MMATETMNEVDNNPQQNEQTDEIMKKTVDNDSTCNLIGIAKVLSALSILCEDLFGLFLQSDKYPEQTVFWIFFGFAFIHSWTEPCAILCGRMSFILKIIIEFLLMICLMFVSDWYIVAIIIFILLFIFQISLEYYIYHNEEPDDNENKAATFANTCCSCGTVMVSGAFVIPLLYFNEDSMFRTTWFDVWATYTIWITGAIQSEYEEAYNEYSNGIELSIWKKFIFWYQILYSAGYTIFYLILSCIYLPDALPGFEYGWTIFMIVFASIGTCCMCCMVMYLCSPHAAKQTQQANASNDTKTQQDVEMR
eukprot:149105_1